MSRRIGLRFGSKAEPCLQSVATGSVTLSLFWLSLLLVWTGPAAAQGMALPGRFAVSPTGAATYSIAIAVPPGSAGMVPSLSIAYNSQARNGLLGMGWHLEGLPSIGRCPRTIAQDGVRGSINDDANDRFCLDGQRLVAISGTYGADGTEYRTEVESFSKIISHGAYGSGPSWFEVWTKSGQHMYFGANPTAQVTNQAGTIVRSWLISSVADTKWNYFNITYVNDVANGQVYPSRIDYTGNYSAGVVPYNSVRFVYNSSRPDVVPAYHVGSLQKTTALLTNVQTFAGSTMVADYRLAYDQSPTTGRSRLTSVTLCTGAGACLPATTFAWQDGTLNPTVTTNVGGLDGTAKDHGPHVGDFNGDGLPDILWSKFDPGANVIWMGTGNGNFTVISGLPAYSRFGPILGDFNRDGKTDIWWARTQNFLKQWTGKGDGTFEATVEGTLWRPSPADKYSLAFVGDGNGDGRSDVGWLFHSSSWGLHFWLTNADGITVTDSWTSISSYYPGCSSCKFTPGAADFNGDGLTDLLWVSVSSMSGKAVRLMHGNGDGTFVSVNVVSDSSMHEYAPYFIDVNGDGKTDIIWDKIDSKGKSLGLRRLWLGKGDGTFVMQSNLGGQDGQLVGYRALIGDFNGDGLPDILWVQEASSDSPQGESSINLGQPGWFGFSAASRVLWLSKGDGTFTIISNFGGLDGTVIDYQPTAADFNGDGKTDILWRKKSTGQRVLWLSDGVATDLMSSVTNGIGTKVTVTYKSMTDSTVYTKDSTTPGAIVDVVDLQTPMALVSRVDVTNAIGGTVSTGYAYAGAKADLNGRGFLGFRQMTVTDLQTNLVQTTSYRQDYPYISLVADETKKIGAVTLNTTAHAYGATLLGGTRFQPFVVQSQAKSADLDGSVLPTITSAYKYDSFGNATEIVVSATDGFSKTTTNIYSNDTAKWLLGRLSRATVASVIKEPGPPPAQPPTDVQVTIFSSTNNLKLWDYLLANGLAKAGTAGTWTITINSGVVIGSSSTSLSALDTGTFPAGSVLKIINNGTIAGAGGSGGNGGASYWDTEGGGGCLIGAPTTSGAPGGPALRAQVAVTIVNDGKIWGGGGGGGGGVANVIAGSGGGGSGSVPGAGGVTEVCGEGGCTKIGPGSPGTLTSGGAAGVNSGCDEGGCWSYPGGAGGNPGQAGSPGVAKQFPCTPPGAGGAAGPAAIGNSFITWSVVGDRKGPLN